MVSNYDILFQESKVLPPKREIQHEIHLQHDATLPKIGMYRSSIIDNSEIKKQVHELLERGDIRPSSSPCGSPIVLVPNKYGTWRMCVDYRVLNKTTIMDMYPLPQIDDLLDHLKNATLFTKLDLRSGYHQICFHDNDIGRLLSKLNMDCMNGW